MKNLHLFLILFSLNKIFCQTSNDKIAQKNNVEFFDCKPIDEHISYIYSPGMMGSELLMGRYCPEFIASTGEKVIWQSGGHIIGQPHSAVKFAEINLSKPFDFTLNPFTAIINSLRKDLFPFIQRFFENKFKFKVYDNPDSKLSISNYSFEFSKANIGQKKDVKELYKTYIKHLKAYQNTKIILFGDSRGSAATLGFLAKYKPNNVKAAILDGCYDTVPHCIKHFVYSDKSPECEKCLHNIIAVIYGSYNKKGPFPIDYIKKIDDNIPLLFVTSANDGLTELQCALNLYIKLKERNFKKIHLLVLDKALHPCYMIDNLEDTEKYESVVHAFYKFYNLPHNSEKALKGKKEFEKTQPTIEELKKLYNNIPKCELCLIK